MNLFTAYGKPLLLGLALVAALLVVVGTITITVFGEKLAEQALAAFQKQTTTEWKLQTLDVSFLPYFPTTALRLRKVEITGADQRPLLKAEELSFKISLWDLLFSRLKLHRLKMKNGFLHIRKLEKNTWNFEVFRSDSTDTAGPIQANIREARLEGVELLYEDAPATHAYAMYAFSALLMLDYEKEFILLKADGHSQIDSVKTESLSLLANTPLDFSIRMHFDTQSNCLRFDPSHFSLSGVPFQMQGSITDHTEHMYIDLACYSHSVPLTIVSSLYPDAAHLFEKAELHGLTQIDCRILGELSNQKQPDTDITLTLVKGGLTHKRLGIRMESIQAAVSWHSGTAGINGKAALTALIPGQDSLSIRAVLDSKAHPALHLDVDGPIPLGLLAAASGFPIQKASGMLHFDQMHLAGDPETPEKLQCRGSISSAHSSMTLADATINFPTLQIHCSNDVLTVDTLLADGLQSDIELRGQIHHVFSLFLKNPVSVPVLTLEAWSDRCHLSEISAFLDRWGGDTSSSSEKDESGLDWTAWDMDVNLFCGHFIQNKVQFHNILFSSYQKDYHINGQFQGEAFGGSVHAQVDLAWKQEPQLEIRGTMQGVHIDELFRQCDNFDQTTLTHKHISGKMDGRVHSRLSWDALGNFQEEDCYALAKLDIRDGKLYEFPVLYEFSDFVKMDDLKTVQFAHLSNIIEIKDRMIYLPLMKIQSNALNLEVLGRHSFDQEVDYAVKINAGQVLTHKFKKHDPTLQPVPWVRDGWFYVYYRMYGHMDDLQFKPDRSGIARDIQKSDSEKHLLEQKLHSFFDQNAIFADESDLSDDPFFAL
jgi:hypothetical protein